MSGEEDGNGWVFGLTFIGGWIVFVLGMGVWSTMNPYGGWQNYLYIFTLLGPGMMI